MIEGSPTITPGDVSVVYPEPALVIFTLLTVPAELTVAVAVAVTPILLIIDLPSSSTSNVSYGFDILIVGGDEESYPEPPSLILSADIVPAIDTVAVMAAATGFEVPATNRAEIVS